MAPVPKAKAAGVSAGSFLDLKAELAKKEEEFAKKKAAGKSVAVVGGVKRPDKKPTVWAKPNKGVYDRAARDFELNELSRPTLESARAVLERKAKIYEKLSKGKSGGLNDKQYDALLVDFDAKPAGDWASDSDDVDESVTVPKPPTTDDDPIVEYEDEFGRMRTAPRSEVPRHLLEPEKDAEEDFDPYLIYNPVNHFPTYEPSEERKAAIQEEFAEENNPLNVHYDASAEVRAKGAGFYQFSGDEETRKRQMEELKQTREETEKSRQEAGATDVKPGEVEGMTAEEAVIPKKSRALEKRKREIEERRKLIEAKRRKKDPSATTTTDEPSSSQPKPPLPPTDPMDALAQAPPDPFAALEAQSTQIDKGKCKQAASVLDAADAFLANLEMELMSGKQR